MKLLQSANNKLQILYISSGTVAVAVEVNTYAGPKGSITSMYYTLF